MTPNFYKCIKLPLKHIFINNDTNILIIEDAVNRTNQIVIKAYQLIKLWILTKYNKGNIPSITKETFNFAFRAIMKNSKKCEDPIYDDLKSLFVFEQENGENLSHLLYQYVSIEMLTAAKLENYPETASLI